MLLAGEPCSCGNFFVHICNCQQNRVWCRVVDFIESAHARRDSRGEEGKEEKGNNGCESHCSTLNYKVMPGSRCVQTGSLGEASYIRRCGRMQKQIKKD